MPSTMIHLLLAHKINPNGCGLYFLGSFAPDAFDDKREDKNDAKNTNHFRNATDMEVAITEFYTQIDKSNPFHIGYFVHLICDMWWQDMIDSFRKWHSTTPNTEPNWYKAMMHEYRLSGVYIRQTKPWVNEVFTKMLTQTDSFQSPLPDPSNNEIYARLNKTVNAWKADKQKPLSTPSAFFTDEYLDMYANEVAQKYMDWTIQR